MTTGVAVVPKKHRYPAITANSKDPGKSISNISQLLEILTGSRGNGLDRALTPRDLLDMGLANLQAGQSPGTGVLIPVDPTGRDENIDLPVQPTNVQAVGGFTAILVSFDTPAYRGHFEAQIWRSSTDVVGSATMVATIKGNLYSDPVATGSTFYYWVRFVNRKDDIGPWHGLSGVQGKTQDDIGWLIEQITQETNDSPLVKWLRDDVDLINEDTYLELYSKMVDDLEREDGPMFEVWAQINGLNLVKQELLSRTSTLDEANIAFDRELKDVADRLKTIGDNFGAFYDAAVSVDPDNGSIKLKAVETYRDENDARVTKVEEDFNAVNGTLLQKVSRTELDGLVGEPFSPTELYDINDEVVYAYRLYRCHTAIVVAGAWTGDMHWTLLGSLQGKFTDVYQKLDAANGRIDDKVSKVDFNAYGLRLTSVEQSLTAYTDETVSVGQMVTNIRAEMWVDAEQALASELDKWNASIRDGRVRIAQAVFNQDINVKVTAHEATLEKVDQALTQYGEAIAANVESIKLVSKDLVAEAKKLSELSVDYGTSKARVNELYDMSATSDSAFLVAYRQLSAKVGTEAEKLTATNAKLTEVVDMKLSPTTALMTSISNASTTAGTALSKANDVLNLSGTVAGSALASRFSSLSSQIGTVSTSVSDLREAIVGPNGAIASALSQYRVSYGGTSVSLQQLASAAATNASDFSAMWGVKSSVAGLQAGFGLYNNGSTTKFVINAQTLAVLGANDSLVNPFMVVNGKTLIDTALIKAASIQELVAGTIVADTIKASASITSPIIVGGSITGSDLNLISGSYRVSLQPYNTFLLWAGVNGVSQNVANASLAVSNTGAVYAKGLTIYDAANNIILDSSGLRGTYIRDLSVSSFQIIGGAVNLKEMVPLTGVPTANKDNVLMASCSVTVDTVVPGSLVDVQFSIAFRLRSRIQAATIGFTASLYCGEELLGQFEDVLTGGIKDSDNSIWTYDQLCRISGRHFRKFQTHATNVALPYTLYIKPTVVFSLWDGWFDVSKLQGYLLVDIGKR